uniref:Uncharacterized protein n=1 Tax=Romanomermis culicivorax TaxID=13658 RepID=A0A915J759_ROMCU
MHVKFNLHFLEQIPMEHSQLRASLELALPLVNLIKPLVHLYPTSTCSNSNCSNEEVITRIDMLNKFRLDSMILHNNSHFSCILIQSNMDTTSYYLCDSMYPELQEVNPENVENHVS